MTAGEAAPLFDCAPHGNDGMRTSTKEIACRLQQRSADGVVAVDRPLRRVGRQQVPAGPTARGWSRVEKALPVLSAGRAGEGAEAFDRRLGSGVILKWPILARLGRWGLLLQRIPARVVLFVLLTVFPVSVWARAERGSWQEVEGLAAGAMVKVGLAGGKVVTGSFAGLSADSLRVVEQGSERSVARGEVMRVEVKDGAKRARNALVGAAVGLGIGVLLDAAVGGRLRNETGQGAGARAATYGIPMAAGVGLGSLISNSYRTIYVAPRSRK